MTLFERYNSLGSKQKTTILVGFPTFLYLALYSLPGSGPVLTRNAPVGVVVIGIVLGTVTALLAIGLILIYRTNRFINFAYGAMGSLGGVTAIGLHLAKGVPFFVALPIGVALGIGVGALIDVAVIRRFSESSPLILTVASIGLAQLLTVIELLIATRLIKFPAIAGGFEIPLDMRIGIGAAKTLTGSEMLIVFSVPPVIAFLAWFLLRTDAGVAVRAAAENADRALLLGIPIRKLSTIVWCIAGGLAALTFVLKSPFTGITPGGGATISLLLPALAAAVVARMESLPVAFGAGVSLGVIEQLVRWASQSGDGKLLGFIPLGPTFNDVVFLLVILVALLAQRGTLSRAFTTGSTWSAAGIVKPIPRELRRLPEVRAMKIGALVLVALLLLIVPATWTASNQFLAGVAITYAITAVSLVILTGWGGHISLGQFGIVGVGAWVGGAFAADHNIDLFYVLILAGLAGAVVSLVVGLPALRIQGLFLAVTTLAFAIALNNYFLNFDNFPSLLPQDVKRPIVFERFDLTGHYTMYVFCLVMLVFAILAANAVRSARGGRVIIATRDNNRAADSAGIPTTQMKLTAFVLAGVIAGVAGGLHIILLGSLNPGTYNPTESLTVFATAVIGGLGSLGGAITGVLLFRFLETQTWLNEFRQGVTGVGLLVVLYFFPGGIGQLIQSLRDRILKRIAARRDILVPSLFEDRLVEDGDEPDDSGLLAAALSAEATPSGNGNGDREAHDYPEDEPAEVELVSAAPEGTEQ